MTISYAFQAKGFIPHAGLDKKREKVYARVPK